MTTDREREAALEAAWDQYWNKADVEFDPTGKEMFSAGWQAGCDFLLRENEALRKQLEEWHDERYGIPK